MKAVLYRHGTDPAKTYEHIVLAEDAVTLHVQGEYVVIRKSGAVDVAAVKLGEKDHIKFEPAS
jgi:hypothetical protein